MRFLRELNKKSIPKSIWSRLFDRWTESIIYIIYAKTLHIITYSSVITLYLIWFKAYAQPSGDRFSEPSKFVEIMHVLTIQKVSRISSKILYLYNCTSSLQPWSDLVWHSLMPNKFFFEDLKSEFQRLVIQSQPELILTMWSIFRKILKETFVIINESRMKRFNWVIKKYREYFYQ
jgi:hypothetical protein